MHEDRLVLHPLAPATWDYLALDGLKIRGYDVSILWDRTGQRYHRGQGLSVWVDGKQIANQMDLKPMAIELPEKTSSPRPSPKPLVNHLVNNDGNYYPRLQATSTQSGTSIAKVQDGNYWYMQHPPNRWESGSIDPVWIDIEFGTARRIDSLDLLLLDDTIEYQGHGHRIDSSKAPVAVPQVVKIETFRDGKWESIQQRDRDSLRGKSPNKFALESGSFERLRIHMQPQTGKRVGLTEIQAWGPAALPYRFAPGPSGNLAYRAPDKEFPKATASHSDRFGGLAKNANDGKTVFDPNPVNRWTSYESTQNEDWLELDLGESKLFSRLELAIYDDRGGVQAPESYRIEIWEDGRWTSVQQEVHQPEKPAGGQWNQATFTPAKSSKVRIVFRHKLPAKSGVSEVMLWE